ncbi:hypothetical protein IMSAG013_01154 [Clostridiales bacterium]|nr:hypothetical protein IMSAG013_01154 [Clostridiales bacterium]
MKWEWIEPPREATVEALYIWAQQLTEILNRMETDKEGFPETSVPSFKRGSAMGSTKKEGETNGIHK